MARFLAITSRGLGDALNREVVDLGLKVLNHNQAGVLFESNWQQMYSANLCLRTATRILLPVLDFAAYDPDQLYGNMRRHDFTKYINEDDTLAVVATVSEAGPFPNQLFVAQKVKDAIVDQFSNKYGRRPSVDKKNPTMKVWVKVKGSNISVSIDTSGESLSQRGYRQDQGLAPLREHLAAGLISQTGWRGECTLIDPMCGSGTLLIEAALLVLNKGPGLYRREFAFQRYKNFQAKSWEMAKAEVEGRVEKNKSLSLCGFDINPRAVAAAVANVKRAGLSQYITIAQQSVENLQAINVSKPPLFVVNPPYGERLESQNRVEDLYMQLARKLKTEFSGSTLWLLSGNKELTPFLKMKSERAYKVDNGGIECRWLKYPIQQKPQ